MKTQTAKLNYLRMAPRKVRLIASMIKGLPANEAEAQLVLNPRKAKEPVLKLLRSAISNSKQKDMKIENLFVKEARVDNGPVLKRFLPRAQGRASSIQKKSSHITLILGESEKSAKARFNIVKQERVSKRKVEKIKKEMEKSKTAEKEMPKISAPESKEGFTKRMFRRKSV